MNRKASKRIALLTIVLLLVGLFQAHALQEYEELYGKWLAQINSRREQGRTVWMDGNFREELAKTADQHVPFLLEKMKGEIGVKLILELNPKLMELAKNMGVPDCRYQVSRGLCDEWEPVLRKYIENAEVRAKKNP